MKDAVITVEDLMFKFFKSTNEDERANLLTMVEQQVFGLKGKITTITRAK